MLKILHRITVLASAALTTGLYAQNPGQGITVTINVKSIVLRGDTVGVQSQVTNAGSSRDSLLTYMVDTPSGVTQIVRPAPLSDWFTLVAFRSRPMASWISGQTLPPGTASPDLYFESVGVPAIVAYWAEGEHEPPDLRDAPEGLLATDPLSTAMVTGKTVGVMPWPVDRTAAGLLLRLRGLAQSACAPPTLWITDGSLCTQLVADLDQAETFRANGQTEDAKNSLDSFQQHLGTSVSYSAGVSASAFWLLVPNAEIVKNAI